MDEILVGPTNGHAMDHAEEETCPPLLGEAVSDYDFLGNAVDYVQLNQLEEEATSGYHCLLDAMNCDFVSSNLLNPTSTDGVDLHLGKSACDDDFGWDAIEYVELNDLVSRKAVYRTTDEIRHLAENHCPPLAGEAALNYDCLVDPMDCVELNDIVSFKSVNPTSTEGVDLLHNFEDNCPSHLGKTASDDDFGRAGIDYIELDDFVSQSSCPPLLEEVTSNYDRLRDAMDYNFDSSKSLNPTFTDGVDLRLGKATSNDNFVWDGIDYVELNDFVSWKVVYRATDGISHLAENNCPSLVEDASNYDLLEDVIDYVELNDFVSSMSGNPTSTDNGTDILDVAEDNCPPLLVKEASDDDDFVGYGFDYYVELNDFVSLEAVYPTSSVGSCGCANSELVD